MRYIIALLTFVWTATAHAQVMPERYVDTNPPAVRAQDPLADYFICAIEEPEFNLPNVEGLDGFHLRPPHIEAIKNTCGPGIDAGLQQGYGLLFMANSDEYRHVVVEQFTDALRKYSVNASKEGELEFRRGVVVASATVDALRIHPNNVQVGVRPGDYFNNEEEKRAVYVYAIPSTWSNRRLLEELTGRVQDIEDRIDELGYDGLTDEDIDRIVNRIPPADIDESAVAADILAGLENRHGILIGATAGYSSFLDGALLSIDIGYDWPYGAIVFRPWSQWNTHEEFVLERGREVRDEGTGGMMWGKWQGIDTSVRLFPAEMGGALIAPELTLGFAHRVMSNEDGGTTYNYHQSALAAGFGGVVELRAEWIALELRGGLKGYAFPDYDLTPETGPYEASFYIGGGARLRF